MHFKVSDNKIILCRYKIAWTDENKNAFEDFAATENEAKHIADIFGGTVEQLDTTNHEWIDGITFEKTNMPVEKAREIIQMGEDGYKKWLQEKQNQNSENLFKQITQTQLAMAEVYEMMLGG